MEAFSEFLEAAFLFVDHKSSLRYAMRIIPEGYDLGKEYQSVIANAFPYERCTATHVYAFTIEERICYSWTFRFEEETHAIVLVGRVPAPHLYLNFLRDMADSVAEQKRVIDPDVLLTLVTSIMSSWHFMENGNEVLVQYSQKPFVVELGSPRRWLRQFKPYQHFELLFDFIGLWKALMTGERILIVGPKEKPEVQTTVMFGVCGMCGAIPYREKVMLMPNCGDPRNMEDLSDYKVVVTSSKYLQKNCADTFAVVAEVGEALEPENDLAAEDINSRNVKLESIICFLLKIHLGMDPYSDVLKKPYVTDDLRQQMSEKTMKYVLDVDQLFKFQALKSAQMWRDSMLWKSDFRDKFLSMQPDEALGNKTREELLICRDALDEVEKRFPGDLLMTLNIKKHRKYLKQKLAA